MPVATPNIAKTEIAIVELTNAFRRENKLAPVKPDATLAKAARAFADYLAHTDTFSHTADGRRPVDRIKAAGYAYCDFAENLALNLDSEGFETRKLAGEVVEGWKGSPGHRKNMLLPNVSEIGVAVARAESKDPKYVSVQLFGRPQSLSYSFKIRNLAGRTVQYEFLERKQEIAPQYTITHTSCAPGSISFQGAANASSASGANGRFEATGGSIYVLRADPGGAVKVEVTR